MTERKKGRSPGGGSSSLSKSLYLHFTLPPRLSKREVYTLPSVPILNDNPVSPAIVDIWPAPQKLIQML
jgi:hypothetical protein